MSYPGRTERAEKMKGWLHFDCTVDPPRITGHLDCGSEERAVAGRRMSADDMSNLLIPPCEGGGPGEDSVEVTEGMLAAGEKVAWSLLGYADLPGFFSSRVLVERVFRAMYAARLEER